MPHRLALRTRLLNLARSAGVSVSALAMTGMRLTREDKRFITSMSSGLSVWPVGRIKYRQAWTRKSILS